MRRRVVGGRRRRRDLRPHRRSAPCARAPGEPRAARAAERPPRRPPRAGPRRRRRRDRHRPRPTSASRCDPTLLRYVVEKGSITIDGISLTVVEPTDDGFTVAVIPHTHGGHHARAQGPRRPREPRGRRHRQVRRAPALLEGWLTCPSPRSKTPSPRSRGARSSSSSTTRTARTRATSSWRPSSPRRRRSRSSSTTPRATCARRSPSSGPTELDLPLMVVQNTESQRTAFLVTVDYRHGTSTGISAYDRSATVQALCDPATRPATSPGPGTSTRSMAREGGVLKRAGHTEATIDLCTHGRPLPRRAALRDRRRQEDRHGPGARARALRRRSTACS